MGYAAVSGGATIDIPVTAKSTASAIVPKGAKANAFRISFKMDANALPAPIRKGETLVKAVFTYNERIVGSVPVIAGKDVKPAPLRMVFPQFDSYIADKPNFGYLAILFRLFI